MPFTPWQRLVSKFLPYFDPDEQAKRLARTEKLAQEVSRIDSIRIAYRAVGDRPFVERRSARR